MGLAIDASSEYEALDALAAGIPAHRIVLNSQQLPRDFASFLKHGIFFTATSLHQLESYGRCAPNTDVALRLNPGDGSGASRRVTTGGPSAGFGIWHEQLENAMEISKRYGLRVTKVHTHIGAGTDPHKWVEVAKITLALVRRVESASCVSMGGGFKVARMPDEKEADLRDIGGRVATLLKDFAEETGRKLHLEIEPGTYLSAGCGVLVSSVVDVTNTGKEGYHFLRLDTGMNDILRPTLYGALHPITLHQQESNTSKEQREYVVIGHNCESGDILTPARGEPEQILPRLLPEAQIGDLITIGAAGAYCASMRAKGYNAFPSAEEIFV